jgi:MFS family permease
MRTTIAQYRTFSPPIRLLLVNQLSINIGFYMLMPYLADHLSGRLGLATWLVGLILGVRNFSQQGMFLVGGSLADRLGYKPLIVAGCTLRTVGFALLGFADAVPALVVASAATGFAGALFNPAVRAYLATEAGERRVEAFALFNVFYQAGILLGPLVGLLLTGIAFQLTCLVAALVFAVLSVLQVRSLPARRTPKDPAEPRGGSLVGDWRTVAANRSFVLFSAAMVGSYVLAFQVYLALPLEARRVMGDGMGGKATVAALFVVAGLIAIAGQVSVTEWCKQRWRPGTCLATGLVALAVAFLPPVLVSTTATFGTPASPAGTLAVKLLPLVASAALLTLGTVIVFPFEMATIVVLSAGRLPATHYGLYNTICGIGILAGNFLTGSALDWTRTAGVPAIPWLSLVILGLACAAAVRALDRNSRLGTLPEPVTPPRPERQPTTGERSADDSHEGPQDVPAPSY